ncbi:hypothetical protein H0H10_01405 [Streptomyces sp. TRM S81-3]|uniref:Uncharacterized protein n=1 Tax=Streptomyces griseicoloratus TaxID=2752516 RepID=A0A926QNU9_9ACTN|nr:hypothetical protein [Streptomyces griseicoloratus]
MAEKAPGAGTVLPHWHEAATVEVLVVDYRRIVEPVAARWVKAISDSVGTDEDGVAVIVGCEHGTDPGVISQRLFWSVSVLGSRRPRCVGARRD